MDGKSRPMLDPPKTLLLGGSDQLTVTDQRSGRIIIETLSSKVSMRTDKSLVLQLTQRPPGAPERSEPRAGATLLPVRKERVQPRRPYAAGRKRPPRGHSE